MTDAFRFTSALCSALCFAAAAACGSAPPPAAPSPAGAPTDAGAPAPQARPSLSPEDCAAKGGNVVGDIGDGRIHTPEFRCPSGSPPIATVPVGIEGSVCCT